MANEKILQLPSGSPLQPGDAIPIARPGANFSVAASAFAGVLPLIDVQIGGNTSGTTALISSGLMFLAGGNNITLSQNGQAVTISAGASGGGGFSAGVSGGNFVGTTGLTASQLVLAGGNNVTLSQSNNTAGASITISAASQTVQTQNVVDVTLGGNTSGALALISSGTLFLAGGNNVTLSQNGNSITISANTAAAATLSVSAGSTSGAFQGLTFSNSNGFSFGLNNGTITGAQSIQTQATGAIAATGFATTTTNGSVILGTHNTTGFTLAVPPYITTQTVQTQNAVDVTLGGNTAGAGALISSGTLFLAGGNNVTLSQNGNSVTISANTAAAASLSISAGTTSSGYGGVTFANANNNTWGLNNGTLTVSAPLNLSVGTITSNVTQLAVVASGLVSVQLSGGSLLISGPQSTAISQSLYATGNTTQSSSGTASIGSMLFAGAGIISVGISGGSVLISATGGGGGGANFSGGVSNIGNSAGNTGITGSQLVLAGGNNITLSQVTGANGATITVSAGTQTNQTIGFFASSHTYGQSSSSGVDARSVTLVGQGIVSVGMSAGSVLLSASQSVQSMGIYGSSQTTGQASSTTVDARSLTVVGAGIISVGLSQGSLLISGPGTTAISQSLYATGNTTQSSSGTQNFGSLLINGAGNVSVGYSNGSLIISGAGSGGGAGGAAISAGTQSQNTGTVSFSNANGVSFGLSAGTMTASVPSLSTVIGAGGISVSTTGSTISIYENPVTRMIWPFSPQLTAIGAPGQGSISVQYVAPLWPVTASRIDALVSWSGGTAATAATVGIALSAYAAIFTRNGSTLSSLSSGSTQATYTYASNSAGAPLYNPAMRPVSVPVNMSMTPGEYFVAFNFSTAATSIGASTTNLGQTLSMMGGNDLQTAANYAEITAGTATSSNWFGGMGIYTAASAGIGASLALSNIAQTGASLSQANIALVFRNA